jgi:hypothetical protein
MAQELTKIQGGLENLKELGILTELASFNISNLDQQIRNKFKNKFCGQAETETVFNQQEGENNE